MSKKQPIQNDHLRCLELLENLRVLLLNPQPNEVWVAARNKHARDLNDFLNGKLGRAPYWVGGIEFVETGDTTPPGAV